ncbi:hypothetical protein G7Y89_g14344 [Cudoniella acicularis]|uniref:Uncharacterized protein n=1 Tax=Cudoniella acicularis TaxID=354080 RepID=A0A8H4R3D0_9HELO|nr:hypothetical protein G7Y89_g14344 [Cudoniella acicularis]
MSTPRQARPLVLREIGFGLTGATLRVFCAATAAYPLPISPSLLGAIFTDVFAFCASKTKDMSYGGQWWTKFTRHRRLGLYQLPN